MRRRTLIGAGSLVAAGTLALATAPMLGANADTSTSNPGRPAAAVDSRAQPLLWYGEVGAYNTWLRTTAFWQGVMTAVEQATRPRSQGGGGCAPGDWECVSRCVRRRESDRNDKGGAGNYDQGYAAVGGGGTYRGAYQFDQSTWDSNAAAAGRYDLVGQDPAAVAPSDQDQVAYTTYQHRGTQPWGGSC